MNAAQNRAARAANARAWNREVRAADARQQWTIDGRAPRTPRAAVPALTTEDVARAAIAGAAASRAAAEQRAAQQDAQFAATVCAAFQGTGQRCTDCRIRKAMHG